MTTQTLPSATRRNAQEGVARRHPYANIVVALDGSRLAEQVLEDVLPLARVFGSKVTCVCAVEPIPAALLAESGFPGGLVPYKQIAETEDETYAEDASYLTQMTNQLQAEGIDAGCEEPEGKAAEVIVDSAKAHHADLIAMTTHGRSGLGRALLGSVADQVVRTAPCPVLLVKSSSSHETK